MKITLEIGGHEMVFTEKELASILKEHFIGFATEEEEAYPGEKPKKDECFMVNPMNIDRTYFEEKRKDKKQEKTRKIIVKAFAEVDHSPEEYNRVFWIMVPEKKWAWKTVKGLQQVAINLGGHTANWVEQALAWAQQLYNEQSDSGWENLCNKEDTSSYYRMVIWGDYISYIGDSKWCANGYSPTDMFVVKYRPTVRLDYTVPLVVLND